MTCGWVAGVGWGDEGMQVQWGGAGRAVRRAGDRLGVRHGDYVQDERGRGRELGRGGDDGRACRVYIGERVV